MATSPGPMTVNNTACTLPAKINGLTRFEKDVDETTELYFDDIMGKMRRPLLESLRKTRKNFRPFAIRLLVLGLDESSAKPYIVVFCPDCISDTVRVFFRMDKNKRLCQPGKAGPAAFDVTVEGSPPEALVSQHLHLTSVVTGRPTSGLPEYRNTHLKIDGIRGTRYATMGGYIVVINQNEDLSMYGLTAGHSIVQDDLEEEVQNEHARDEPDPERNIYPELATSVSSQLLGSMASQSMRNTTYSISANSQEAIEWSGTATVAAASFSSQAFDRDWALLEAIADQPVSGTEDGQPFERYLLGDPRSGTVLLNDAVGMNIQPPFIGKLSRLPSFAILPYGNDFVRIHIITMRNGHRIPAGSSGTWVSTEVIEPTSNTQLQSATADNPDDGPGRKITVFGQVVADDVLGDVYVVPLRDILDDVKSLLNAREARLPKSNLEINRIMRMTNDSGIKSSETEAYDLMSTQMSENEVEAEERSSPQQGQSSAAAFPAVTASYTPSAYSAGKEDPTGGYKEKEKVWFCHNCNDGPVGQWQNVCSSCGHEFCNSCVRESAL